jgi:hypothetical protein
MAPVSRGANLPPGPRTSYGVTTEGQEGSDPKDFRNEEPLHMRWLGIVLLAVFLLACGYLGFNDAIVTARTAHGIGQWILILGQIIYSVFAVLTVAALGARHRIARLCLHAWGIATIVVALLTPMVAGGAVFVGLTAGAATIAVVWFAAWVFNRRPDELRG